MTNQDNDPELLKYLPDYPESSNLSSNKKIPPIRQSENIPIKLRPQTIPNTKLK